MAVSFVAASSERISLGTTIDLFRNVAGATLMGWMNPTTAVGSLMQCSVGGGTAPSRVTLEISGGSWLGASRRLDADGATSIVGPATGTGTWKHIALVARWTGGGLDLYVDGALFGTTANGGWTANSSNTAAGVAHIGSEDDGLSNYANGKIDDVRCYNRALTAREINTIYRARGADTIILDLAHRYTMNEAQSGASVSGAGSVRDKGAQPFFPGTATNTPTYTGEQAINRRRRRAA